MRIDRCEFPDDLLYEGEGLVWARLLDSGDAILGVTSIYAAVAGPVAKVSAKPTGVSYGRGAAIAFLESGKYFGPIRTPVSGELREINAAVLAKPRLMTDAAYAEGWVARVRLANVREARKDLRSAADAREGLAKQIAALRVRCFAAFPDHEMFEIGIECSAILAKLDELLTRIRVGEVVHLVTDDPTSPIEMVRWSDQTGHPVIDERREANLFHFLVRKAA
jgi:glycine cleavage system H lipoate-binding protein/TusA-related sulfurtransferase